MEEIKGLDVYIEMLPKIDDILDLKVPGTLLLVKPYTIDTEIKTASGLFIPQKEEIKMRTLAKGVVVTTGTNCQEVKAGNEVFFYKPACVGSFTSGGEVYQLYQEYDIHAYLVK